MDMETRTFETPGKSGKGSINWEPEFTTPVIMKICRALGLTIVDLTEERIFKLPIESFLRAIWLCVAGQAAGLGIKEKEFFELLPPCEIMNAIGAIKTVAAESFPQVADMGDAAKETDEGDEGDSPKEPGD